MLAGVPFSQMIEAYVALVRGSVGSVRAISETLTAATPLILTGSDKQVLGQVAANMRALRPPDPYKNKGIRFAGEVLIKKAGKTAGSK